MARGVGYQVKRICSQTSSCWVCCPQNGHRCCAKRKVKCSGGKWWGSGNSCIHPGKSDGLSPPDNSPSDKCGQAAEEPACAVTGCSTAIRTEPAWAKWGSEATRPQAEKLRQHRRSFQLLLAKPLKKFTRRHSPHSANIGYRVRIFVCLNSCCARVSGTSVRLSMVRKQSRDRKRQREKLLLMSLRCWPLENTPWNVLFHRKWLSEHHELIPWWRSGSLCSRFLLCASACPDTG